MKAKKSNGNKTKAKDAKDVEPITYESMGNAIKDAARTVYRGAKKSAKTVYRGAKKGARAVQRGLDKAPAVMMDAAMGAVEGYGNLGKQIYQTGKLLATGDKEKYGLQANESYKAEQAKVEANKKKAEAEGKAYREKVERERKERAKAKGFRGGGKMPMYNKGGFNPLPDTSYQSSASKSARAKSANKARQIKEANKQAIRGDMKARQAARFAIEEFGKGDRVGRGGKMDEWGEKMDKRLAVAEQARERAKALANKDLSEVKEYKGGGKMPMYVLGGKVHKNESSLMEALLKNPKQRAAAKRMLGM